MSKREKSSLSLEPSGSGKSTLLRCTNRLEEIQSGDIHITGNSIHGEETNVDKLRQQTGIVFQDFNLFPHMDVTENVALAPKKVKGITKEIAQSSRSIARRSRTWFGT